MEMTVSIRVSHHFAYLKLQILNTLIKKYSGLSNYKNHSSETFEEQFLCQMYPL